MRTQGIGIVVVAGNKVHRRQRRTKNVAQLLVFLGLAVGGEIAGDENDVGRGLQFVEALNDGTQLIVHGDGAAVQLAVRGQVGVGELRDNHLWFGSAPTRA